MSTARTLITLPKTATRGQIIEIRVLIGHPMETGYRNGADGQRLPRNVITRFVCRYDGELVFSAALYPAIAANPYLAFHTVAVQTGTLEFRWEGDNGFVHTEQARLAVV